MVNNIGTGRAGARQWLDGMGGKHCDIAELEKVSGS
jgi:hypothetical protein